MPYLMLVSDPLAFTLILLALLWLTAKIGGELAAWLKLPAVAGQLLMGVVLAILPKVFNGFPNVAKSHEAHLISYIGIILLMFMVGLESSVPQMLKVGWASLRVAVVGVIGPMALGLLAAYLLLPEGTPYAVDLFIGACLCATSIGISVQVLRERHEADSHAGRVIIGAAVIDDVLGLLVLVAVSGLAVATSSVGGTLPWGELGRTLGLALLFLALALTLGRWLSSKIFKFASRFKSMEILSPLALAFAFTMAYLGNLVGLATIVGAYAAGLILEHHHVESLQKREGRSLEEMIQQAVIIFAPLFFVYTAATIDPSALLQPFTFILAGVLTIVGISGKYISGYAAGGGSSVPVIGWGMVPRGEVGLIFVAVGREIKINNAPMLSDEVQAGILGAILMTTILGPIGLSWVLGRK